MTELHDAHAGILVLINRVFVTDDEREVLDSVVQVKEYLERIRREIDDMSDQIPVAILQQVVFRDRDVDERLNRILAQENAELRERLEVSPRQAVAISDEKGNRFYTIEEFIAALHIKMGRTYGWRMDLVTATLAPDVRPVKNEDIQKWQRTKQVPEWAFQQVDKLLFVKRMGQSGERWTDDNFLFLEDLYIADPTTSNDILAQKCSEHFGRNITPDSVKGTLDRRRKLGRLDRYRPK